MSMIEVDPKLFITCRLCVDEMGHYQIVPTVQMQIKYCFEIDVQPFDGLPQLICKKCESILSQYTKIKEMYQVKQNSLKTIKKSGEEKPEENIDKEENNIQQQQDTVSSTQQVESVTGSSNPTKKTNKHKLSLTKKVRSVNSETGGSKSNHTTLVKPATTNKIKAINKPKREKFAWASNYTKQFVCRICSKNFTEKRYCLSHINKHEHLIKKYSNFFNTYCDVKINKVGSTLNLTNTKDNVVFNEKKIIKSVNSQYYILYSSNCKKESSSSESSDEELICNVGKYKRQRLISEDSNKSSVIVEEDKSQTMNIDNQSQVNTSVACDDLNSDSIIDCVNIDSDSTSTQSNQTRKVTETVKKEKKLLYVNKKLISNIITMCYKKYLKRFDNPKNVSKLHGDMDSFLRHKVLSIGTKYIHSKGLNSTGLLRYLEHKNLDINWKQTKNSNSPIIVKTSLVSAKSSDSNINDMGWKSLNDVDQNHNTKDFVDIFDNLPPRDNPETLKDRELIKESSRLNTNENNNEKELSKNNTSIILKNNQNHEKNITINNHVPRTSMITETSENAVLLLRKELECDKQGSKKILNANPVPYPKQLPTKKSNVHETPSLLKSPTRAAVPMEVPRSDSTFVNFDEVAHMPVITSTVSLAPLAEEQKQSNPSSQVTQSNKSGTNLPQIKVKPIAELMPDKNVQNSASLMSMGGWTVTSSHPNDNSVLHSTNPNLVYVANVPQYTNVAPQQPATLCYVKTGPILLKAVERSDTSRQSDSNERAQRKGNQEFVNMHTVELPNTKTSSPFRYFQRLLQINNLILLESTADVSHISTTMKCLIKFSLGFQQQNNAPVTLCLTLYCDKNVFCIKVRDNGLKDIDVSKLSANWQWEILKVFKGDIVSKLNLNALKHGHDMSSKVNHFVSLLKAIIFSKER